MYFILVDYKQEYLNFIAFIQIDIKVLNKCLPKMFVFQCSFSGAVPQVPDDVTELS